MTTFTDIEAGRYAVGTPVAVEGAWVLDVIDAGHVTLGHDDCPPSLYCGAMLATLLADFTQSPPTPAPDDVIAVFGTVTADAGIHVDTYR